MINIILKCQNKKNVNKFIIFATIQHGFYLFWMYLHPWTIQRCPVGPTKWIFILILNAYFWFHGSLALNWKPSCPSFELWKMLHFIVNLIYKICCLHSSIGVLKCDWWSECEMQASISRWSCSNVHNYYNQIPTLLEE